MRISPIVKIISIIALFIFILSLGPIRNSVIKKNLISKAYEEFKKSNYEESIFNFDKASKISHLKNEDNEVIKKAKEYLEIEEKINIALSSNDYVFASEIIKTHPDLFKSENKYGRLEVLAREVHEKLPFSLIIKKVKSIDENVHIPKYFLILRSAFSIEGLCNDLKVKLGSINKNEYEDNSSYINRVRNFVNEKFHDDIRLKDSFVLDERADTEYDAENKKLLVNFDDYIGCRYGIRSSSRRVSTRFGVPMEINKFERCTCRANIFNYKEIKRLYVKKSRRIYAMSPDEAKIIRDDIYIMYVCKFRSELLENYDGKFKIHNGIGDRVKGDVSVDDFIFRPYYHRESNLIVNVSALIVFNKKSGEIYDVVIL